MADGELDMASVAELKPVQTIAEDDGVRERHGCETRSGYCDVREDGPTIFVRVNDGAQSYSAWRETCLTPSRARYIARKLLRLARRIEKRELA